LEEYYSLLYKGTNKNASSPVIEIIERRKEKKGERDGRIALQ
jgi:hypothetical protein